MGEGDDGKQSNSKIRNKRDQATRNKDKRQDNKRWDNQIKDGNSGVWVTQQQLHVMLNLWIES